MHNEVSIDMKVKDIRDFKKQANSVNKVIIPEDDSTEKLAEDEKSVYKGDAVEKNLIKLVRY